MNPDSMTDLDRAKTAFDILVDMIAELEHCPLNDPERTDRLPSLIDEALECYQEIKRMEARR